MEATLGSRSVPRLARAATIREQVTPNNTRSIFEMDK